MTAGSGFLFWILAARLATPAAVGLAAGVISIVGLLNYLTSLGLPYGVLRFAGIARDSAPAIVNAGVIVTFASSAAVATVVVVAASSLAPKASALITGLELGLIFILLNGFVAVGLLLDSVFTAFRVARYSLFASCFVGLLRPVALVFRGHVTATVIYLAMYVPLALVTAALLIALPRLIAGYRRTLRLRTAEVANFVAFSLRVFPASLSAGAPAFLLPVIFLALRGPAQMAYFFVAWTFVRTLNLIPAIVAQVTLSEGARASTDDVALAQRFALALACPAVLVLVVLATPVLSLFGAGYSAHSAFALRIFVLSVIPWTLVTQRLAVYRLQRNYRRVNTAAFGFACCTLTTSAVATALYGIRGTAIGWTAGSFAAAAVITLYPALMPAVHAAGWGRRTKFDSRSK